MALFMFPKKNMNSHELKLKREGIKRGIYILPNLFTTANLFCGFFATISAINENYVHAAWAILLASVFDFLDGRVARLTRTQSEFGLEYDSIVDVCSFGLAPAVLIYTWSLYNFKRFGWSAAFLFFACGALRLARFNVQAKDVEKKSFQGLPIPGAALCLATYVIMQNHLFGYGKTESYAILIMTFVLSLLMVSNIPYRSFKALDRDRRVNFFILVILVGALFIIGSAPQVMLFVLAIGYVVLGVVEEILRSPKKIASFADFMSRYFQADPKDFVMDAHNEPEESQQFTLYEMPPTHSKDDESMYPKDDDTKGNG